ncbi:protein methyltransferase [Serendipita vermifera]|nr:protein methyltransferase [Serendipita vermifera]
MSKQEKDRVLSTPHLNIHGLKIYSTKEKGRGVYASRCIPRGTTIEISPVLFFSEEEYSDHGRYTILDHYTFIWGDGRMALPLGLGSLFNHSSSPNVTYTKRKSEDCIEYSTSKDVLPGEELVIFYGHKLWFQDASTPTATAEEAFTQEENVWNAMAAIDM